MGKGFFHCKLKENKKNKNLFEKNKNFNKKKFNWIVMINS